MSARRTTSGRRVAAALAAGVLAVLVAATGAAPTPSAAAPATVQATVRPGEGLRPDGSYRLTRTLQRVFEEDGQQVVVDEREVTVRVDETRDLRGRERVRISWEGARPSGARAANPYGEGGTAQEYPVVIMQCRGLDDASLPPAEQLRPETCWTSSRVQRSATVDDRVAVWRHDLFADEADRAKKSGLDPFPAAECRDVAFLSTHLTPFVASSGEVYPACSADTMPPEAAVGAAFPPAELAAFTDLDGRGDVQFEVRTATENESLGCSSDVACSIVVIPVMGLSCVEGDVECRRGGRFAPGSSNFAAQGVDAAVSPLYWWSESNWRHRFAVPLSFGLPPDTCDVLDPRPPTGFYGTELISQAALQWSPAYCLREDRFKFQHNRMSDEAAFALMESGGGVAALVSGPHEQTGPDPVAYAPTAVTGFAVAYVADRPENAGEVTDLRLNARLLAKLYTQSYLGSDLGRGRSGTSGNPLSINQDPEFQALNPGIDDIAREAGAALLSLSESSDVVGALTAYIAADPEARAFMSGKPDPWGMRVNPAYEDLELPTDEWPLLDDFVPSSEQECLQQNPAPYFTQLAAPVTSLRKIAEAVLDAWPNVQTRCERASTSDPFRLGRVERQGVGSRFVLGVVSLGDAARLGLRTARLEAAGGQYVGPSAGSLRAAIATGRSTGPTQPLALDQDRLLRQRGAYPGTLVVYTAARTSGLPRADAAKVAQFIRTATTEGQRPGGGNGQLPEGYLPITASGPTAPLLRQARAVADLVEAQRPVRSGGDGDGDGTGGGSGGPAGGPSTVPSGDLGGAPADAAGPDVADDARTPGAPAPADAQVVTAPTQAVSSPLGRVFVPVLLVLAVVGALGALAGRISLARRGAW